MAPTNRPSSHYASQAGLSAAFARIIRAEWERLDRTRLYALLTRFSQASATLAAQDYTARRREAGIRSSFTVPHAAPPGLEHFDKTLNWVFDVVSDDTLTPEQRAIASMSRLVTQTGRLTTVEAVQADRQARAWAREARPDCCYFCAALSSRGAVYRDDRTADRTANEKFTGEGEFKFHNNCHCIAVPVFGAYEPTAEARQWAADWAALKEKHGGVSLHTWRLHFEGREAPTDNPRTAG